MGGIYCFVVTLSLIDVEGGGLYGVHKQVSARPINPFLLCSCSFRIHLHLYIHNQHTLQKQQQCTDRQCLHEQLFEHLGQGVSLPPPTHQLQTLLLNDKPSDNTLLVCRLLAVSIGSSS